MVKVEAAAIIFEWNKKFFIHKRPVGEIMGGLWEFPEWKLARDKKISSKEIESLAKKVTQKDFNMHLDQLKSLGVIKRNYTHHLEKLHLFKALLPQNTEFQSQKNWPREWILKKEFADYPFSSAHARIAQKISP